MTFGKDTNPKEVGRLGGLALKRDEDYRETMRKIMKDKWKDSEYRKRELQRLEKERLKMNLSENGKKSRYYENKVTEKIKGDYDKIFNPNDVCDKIGIKDGKLSFIEIKRIKLHKKTKNAYKDGLREKQKEFRDIVESLGFEYVIKYHVDADGSVI